MAIDHEQKPILRLFGRVTGETVNAEGVGEDKKRKKPVPPYA